MCKECYTIRARSDEAVMIEITAPDWSTARVSVLRSAHTGPPLTWDCYLDTYRLGKIEYLYGHWFPGLPGYAIDHMGNPYIHASSAIKVLVNAWYANLTQAGAPDGAAGPRALGEG